MIDVEVLASGSSGNAYLVNDGRTKVLLDAGIPFKELQVALKHKVSSLDGVLVTHEHMDHAKAVKDLLNKGVDVYTGQGTIDKLKVEGHRIHAVKALTPFMLGTFKVLPLDIVHDAAEPLMFVLESKETGERLAYITDTKYVKYRLPPCDYMLVEANYGMPEIRQSVEDGKIQRFLKNRIMESHMSIDTLEGFLMANDKSRLKKIWLIHLSSSNSNEQEFLVRIQRLTGCEVYVA